MMTDANEIVNELFEKHAEEFLEYDKHEHLLFKKRQWYVLERLNNCTPDGSLINSSSHDMITFQTCPEDFLEHYGEDEIVDLIRCGLQWQSEYECFAMYI